MAVLRDAGAQAILTDLDEVPPGFGPSPRRRGGSVRYSSFVGRERSRCARITEFFSARLEAFLIAIGIVLRVRQYLFNRSLWLDEALLTSNILDRSFAGLWRPLEFNQHAPPGFLLIEKAFVEALGPAEVVLRLYPLFRAGIASLFLFDAVARRCLEPKGRRIALLLLRSPGRSSTTPPK